MGLLGEEFRGNCPGGGYAYQNWIGLICRSERFDDPCNRLLTVEVSFLSALPCNGKWSKLFVIMVCAREMVSWWVFFFFFFVQAMKK